ncbi:MAG TPA: hypothetical protein VF455_04935 [Chryseobacterium sp.]
MNSALNSLNNYILLCIYRKYIITSIYYFKNVEEKLLQLDSTVTAEQIISLTKFNISKNNVDPTLLDSLANRTYKLNEEKNYTEAIKTAQILLKKSPNITGHKEISLAYKKIGRKSFSKTSWNDVQNNNISL